MSERMQFRPHEAYTTRCWINALLTYAIVGLGTIAIGIGVAVDVDLALGLAILVVPNLLFLVVAGLYIKAWVASIRYVLTEEEVVVERGVFTRLHTLVPYRTITNVEVRRGWLDWMVLDLGDVDIQTAGAGGPVAEERLVGLRNFQEIRDAVVENLRRYRADTTPALGGGLAGQGQAPEASALGVSADLGQAILEELRAIRDLLQGQA